MRLKHIYLKQKNLVFNLQALHNNKCYFFVLVNNSICKLNIESQFVRQAIRKCAITYLCFVIFSTSNTYLIITKEILKVEWYSNRWFEMQNAASLLLTVPHSDIWFIIPAIFQLSSFDILPTTSNTNVKDFLTRIVTLSWRSKFKYWRPAKTTF